MLLPTCLSFRIIYVFYAFRESIKLAIFVIVVVILKWPYTQDEYKVELR